ncbi:MAG TPA: exonuclease domain-containing protein [Ohtaekwangia sp.]|nr:exonuclease domain-containing protein [Ohtaekwangia sp.]
MDKNFILDELKALSFTALDVETANEARNSLCSIGIVKVKKGTIIREISHHIRPRNLRVSALNQQIHGLSERDLRTELELDHLWDSIRSFLENEVCVAHNAEFDFNVLRESLQLYGLKLPNIKYMCSIKLAQEAFPGEASYRLKDLASAFQLDLNHHNAMSDAKACAAITLRSLQRIDFNVFDWKSAELTTGIEKIAAEGKRDILTELFSSKKIDSALLKPNLEVENKENIFYNKRVVFTGNLQSLERSEAAGRIQAMGADINTAISRRTDIVILGNGAGPAKMKKIEELLAKGYIIRMMTEAEFVATLNEGAHNENSIG